MRRLKYPAVLIFFGSLLSLPLLFPSKPLVLASRSTQKQAAEYPAPSTRQSLPATGCGLGLPQDHLTFDGTRQRRKHFPAGLV